MKKQILQRIITTLPICLLGLFSLPVFAESTNNTTMSDIDGTLHIESIASITTETDTETVTITETDAVIETTTETATSSEQLTIVSITDISYTMGYAIPAGTDWEEFFAAYFSDEVWQLSVPCETTDGDTIYAGITWYDPEPNTFATGSISLTGTLILPDNTTLAESARTFRVHCYVSIQAEGTPTLDSWYIADGAIHLPWISSGVENMNAVVLYQQDESGYWSECDSFYCDSEAVHLNLDSLTYGAIYSIWVVWDEGSTNIFSFTYTGTVSTTNNIGGDRDGGDSSGNSLSGVQQTAPESSEQTDTSDTSDSSDTSDVSDSADTSGSTNTSDSADTSSSADASGSSDASDSSNASGSSDAPSSSDTSGSADTSSSSDASNSADTTDSSEDSKSFTTSTSTKQKSSQTDNEADSSSNSYNMSNTAISESNSNSNSDSGSDSNNSSISHSGNSYSGSDDSSGNEPFMETVTDTYSLISGTRLNLMRQTGSVRFSKQGITVTLSDAALDALDITNDNRFYIEIRKTETGFSLIVELNGQAVTDLPDTTVMLPYVFPNADKIDTDSTNANNTNTDDTDAHTDANYTLLLRDESGRAITGSYNTESGIVIFTIQYTGIYTLITTSSAFETGADIETVLIPDSDANDEMDATDVSSTDDESDAIDVSIAGDESDAVNASDAGNESDAVDTSDTDDESDTEFPLESLISSHDDSDHHSLALSVHVTGIVFAVLFILAATLFFLSCSKTSARRLSYIGSLHQFRRFREHCE